MLFVDNLSVICIENMHLNDRVKITPETKNVLKLGNYKEYYNYRGNRIKNGHS